jgi:flagellar hook-associated protein 2
MAAFGLTGGSTLARGQNAEFTVDGGATLVSASNTLDGSVHGIDGLSLTVDSTGTQTITVAGDTSGMKGAIQDFITQYNAVQSYIDDQSKISTTADGKVTTSVLSSNHEVQDWASSLRSMVFDAVPGLSGAVNRLENLGIDFTTGTSQLEIKDSAKLDAALQNNAADVADFFQTASTGLATHLDGYITNLTSQNSDAQTRLTKADNDIDAQIATIQRRLDQQKAILTASFVAMETAQSALQSQESALNSAFPSTTTKK